MSKEEHYSVIYFAQHGSPKYRWLESALKTLDVPFIYNRGYSFFKVRDEDTFKVREYVETQIRNLMVCDPGLFPDNHPVFDFNSADVMSVLTPEMTARELPEDTPEAMPIEEWLAPVEAKVPAIEDEEESVPVPSEPEMDDFDFGEDAPAPPEPREYDASHLEITPTVITYVDKDEEKTLNIDMIECAESSNISAYGHIIKGSDDDGDIAMFYCRFKSGAIYRYAPVRLPWIIEITRNNIGKLNGDPTASVGSAFHHLIKSPADDGKIYCQKLNDDLRWVNVPPKSERTKKMKDMVKNVPEKGDGI